MKNMFRFFYDRNDSLIFSINDIIMKKIIILRHIILKINAFFTK